MAAQEPSRGTEPTTDVAAVRIKVRENGPLLVTGPVELFDHEGNPFPTEGPNIALCRCGGSARKPFCDGTHRGNGFDGTCVRQS
jgi:CDGSH-type Zn-finger protein